MAPHASGLCGFILVGHKVSLHTRQPAKNKQNLYNDSTTRMWHSLMQAHLLFQHWRIVFFVLQHALSQGVCLQRQVQNRLSGADALEWLRCAAARDGCAGAPALDSLLRNRHPSSAPNPHTCSSSAAHQRPGISQDPALLVPTMDAFAQQGIRASTASTL